MTSHLTENLLQGFALLLALSVAACSSKSSGGGTTPPPTIEAWDWNGVIGTGQSLSVGATPSLSTTQPYNNLKLSLGSSGNAAVPPWDPTLAELAMVPLVEPIRPLATGYPGPYPGNIYGETPHSAMANQITALVKAGAADSDYVTVHSVVGESGQGIVALKKPEDLDAATGTTGRAYAATMFEVNAIARLAKDAGKTYGIRVVTMTHGETDVANTAYESELVQLLADYNADIAAITGQTRKISMYLSQQHGVPNGTAIGPRPLVNLTQWRLGIDHKDEFVCTGPQYQFPGNADGIHLMPIGYQLLGEKYGQVYYEREVLGHDWQPLAPTTVERDGQTVTVHFHVPVPPLNWDEGLDASLISDWANGRGFELRGPSGSIVISSVEIVGDDAVKITADSDLPETGLIVGYALASQGAQMKTGSLGVRWGQLRDSDPFQGSTTQLPNPNYALSFEMLVP